MKFKKRKARTKEMEDRRLALLAQELGTAMVVVLVNDYGFNPEEADKALGKVIAQAKETRLTIAARSATAKLGDKAIPRNK